MANENVKMSINLSKIPKKYVYTSKEGHQWINVVAWLNKEPNQWGKDVSVCLDLTSEQREREYQGKNHYVGSGKTSSQQQQASSASDSLDF